MQDALHRFQGLADNSMVMVIVCCRFDPVYTSSIPVALGSLRVLSIYYSIPRSFRTRYVFLHFGNPFPSRRKGKSKRKEARYFKFLLGKYLRETNTKLTSIC